MEIKANSKILTSEMNISDDYSKILSEQTDSPIKIDLKILDKIYSEDLPSFENKEKIVNSVIIKNPES